MNKIALTFGLICATLGILTAMLAVLACVGLIVPAKIFPMFVISIAFGLFAIISFGCDSSK